MATDETKKIERKILDARSQLLAAVESLDSVGWEWRPDAETWSARMTLAHVGSAQWDHLQVARRLIAEEPTHLPDFDLDAWNAAAVEERAGWPVDQVLADLEAAQEATVALLHSLEDEMLTVTGTHPAWGEVSLRQVLRIIPLHDSMHRRDILKLRKALDKEG
jgi:uncharacterized damage-inducible protein DinB